jgi:UDP-N-acetylglucosamine 1-carboxyvinyltransferase
VERTAPNRIEIEGRRRLRGADHSVVPDRIEAGTFIAAAGVTRGHIKLTGAEGDHLGAFIQVISDMGVSVTCGENTIEVDATSADLIPLRSRDIETQPYPGLATDLQPPTCVMLTQAAGVSRVHESVFEDRLEWLGELRRMGANVDIEDQHHAVITGPTQLHGAEVEIGDLRAGASLILAALAADGITTIVGAHHVHRGYEKIDTKFLELGARIERLAEGT